MQKHLQAMAWVSGLHIQIEGELPPENESFILLSNHVSYWDIIALGSLRPLGFMAKDSIASWPFLGAVTRCCNTLYVSREHVLHRWKALRNLQVQSRDLAYCVFPEGTTTASVTPKLALWRRGNIAVLRKPGIPIWLAGLHYREHEAQAWIDDDALLPHLWKVMQAPRIHLVIVLQRLHEDSAKTLSQVSIASWNQTVHLCKKARNLAISLPASQQKEAGENLNSAAR